MQKPILFHPVHFLVLLCEPFGPIVTLSGEVAIQSSQSYLTFRIDFRRV